MKSCSHPLMHGMLLHAGPDFLKGLSILPLSDVNLAEKGHSFNSKAVAVGKLLNGVFQFFLHMPSSTSVGLE